MSGSRTISIRLSAEGAEEVKRQLEAIGESGDRALGRLTDAAGQVQPALQSVSSVSDDLTRSLADVGFAATGLERVAGRMSSLLSIAGPTAIGIGAVGAAIGGALLAASNFNAETQALEISMRAVGRQADITATSLRSYIRELQAQGVAKDVATKAVTDMARNPAMSDATVGRAAALIPDAAVALQTNAADAARQLTDAFGGTYEGVRKLDDALNFLSSTERDAIRTMLEHGDRAGAVEKEFAALERRIRGMDAEMASPFKQAMNELDAAWQGFIDAVGNSDLVQRALKGITAEVKSLAKAMQEGSAASVADAIPGPLGALGRLVFPHTIAPELTVTASGLDRSDRMAGTPADTAAGAGVTADQQRQAKIVSDRLRQADQEAEAAGKTGRALAELTARREADRIAEEKGLTADQRDRLEKGLLQAELAKLNAQHVEHKRNIDDVIKETVSEVAAQALVLAAYQNNNDAVAAAIAHAHAQKEAMHLLRDGVQSTTEQIDREADAQLRLAHVNSDIASAQSALQNQHQLEYIQRETELLTEETGVRERELAALRERQRIVERQGDPGSDASQKSIRLAADVAEANAALDRQRAAITEIGTLGTQVFDQVGNAITNAFVSGSGQAVNFGNIARGVLASVAQEALKLAVLNPALNALFGGSRVTMGSALSAASSSRSGGGSMLGSLGDALGLGMDGAKLFGYDLSGGLGLSGLMSTPLWGGTTLAGTDAVAGLMAGGANGMIAEGAISSAGVSAMPAATIGGMLGGVGLGFGAGSMLGSLINPNHGTGSMVGSGVGAAAGAAIGSIIPGIGTVIGGLIGGLVGGAGGSLFGPGKKHHGWGYHVETDANGQLIISDPKIDPVAQEQFAAEQQQLVQLNQYLSAQGIRASGTYIVGGNNGYVAGEVPTLAQGASALRFSAANDNTHAATLNRIFAGRAFDNFDALQSAVGFASTYDSLVPSTAPKIGTLQTQIDALNKTFDDAVAKAKDYGLAEDELNASRARQIGALRDAAAKLIADTETGYAIRLARAQGDTGRADLLAFDASATAEQKALTDQLTAAFGDAYTATAEYARITGELTGVLTAERQAIEKRNAAQAEADAQAARGLLTDLTIGTQSALAPEQRYFAGLSLLSDARRSLDAGGSLDDFSTVARQVLPVARDYLGTSERYASLVAEVASLVTSKGGDSAGLGSLLQAQVDGTDALRDTFARYGQQQVDVASATLTELRRLASTLEALIARQRVA